MIPIGHYHDHGNSIETQQSPAAAKLWETCAALATGKRTILKPGGKLPLKGLEAVILASNGATIGKAVNGGGSANSAVPGCAGEIAGCHREPTQRGAPAYLREVQVSRRWRSEVGQRIGAGVPY